MRNLETEAVEMVKSTDQINAHHILNHPLFHSKLETAERFQTKGDSGMVDHMMKDILEFTQSYDEANLTPDNVEVGQGVTIKLWSDSHAGTVIKKTKTQVTVQRDRATLDPDFKPEFYEGGFAGHCHNQNEQSYTYERDPDGEITKFTWSTKEGRFVNRKQGLKLSKGRREFYDYNF